MHSLVHKYSAQHPPLASAKALVWMWVFLVGFGGAWVQAAPPPADTGKPPPSPPTATDFIKPGSFDYQLPGPTGAWATGIGCAIQEQEAERLAQSAAWYNLRSILGAKAPQPTFRRIRKPAIDPNRICLEVVAEVGPDK